MKPFAYISPSCLGDALNALDDPGSNTMVIAGGTDVMVWLNSRIIHPECVVDLRKLEELKFIKEEDGRLRIGARTTFTELIESDLVQRHAGALVQAARESAGPQEIGRAHV